ncbi:MAG TPA: hypothetical protein ENF48_09020 [Desulfobacteraceae bacterium]|nr:hypothetical protein [Deltaproteobacteria bacterium]HDI60476.1 hypothetical protein [Desulfobacteraceae bacterium]
MAIDGKKPVKSPVTASGGREALAAARRQVLALPGGQALERILDHPRPASLVQSFAETDLHLLIHEIGPADALPLLAMASNDQLQYLLDAETWNADRIDGAALTRWIAAMMQAAAERTVIYLMQHQREFLEYFLACNLELRIREHDQDPSVFGDEWFSLDNVFYLRLRPEPSADEALDGLADDRGSFIHGFLRRLADHDYTLFRNLLLESSVLLPAEHEEEMLRQRTVRLAEKGFLPFDEAVGIYLPLAPEALDARRTQRLAPLDPDETQLPVPRVAAGFLPASGAFAEALAVYAASGHLEPIEAEFAALCNRLAVADRRVVRQRSDLAALARKAAGYIGIGLERMAVVNGRFDPARGAALIRRHHLEDVFRVAWEGLWNLKRKAERWQRRSWYRQRGLRLTFWLEEGTGVVGGLLIKRPLFFDNYRSGVLYREFETLADLAATEGVLDAIMALDALLARMTITAPLTPTGALNWKNLLLTLWVRDCLDLGAETLPVDLDALRRFFAELWTTKGKIRQVRRRQFLRWLADRSDQSPDAVSQALAPVLEALFQELEDEYGAVAPEALDQRFVGLFLVA